MNWLRLYHDTITDMKWRVVSNESGEPVGNVLAVWMQMLINASAAEDRGTLEGWNDKYVAAHLGYPTDAVAAIRKAMQGVVLDGDVLTGWDKRQRVSDDAGGRQRKTRERKAKNPPNGTGGGSHGGNGHDCDSAATVAGQTESVARQTGNVARLSLRAQTPDTESNSVASATAPPAAPDASLKSELFGRCLVWLIAASGRPEKSLRPMIGRWIGMHGEGAVLAAIVRAQQEAAVSPVGFVEGVLRSGSKHHGQANGSKHDRLAHGFAGAFGDLLVPRPADTGGECGQIAIGYR
jgi:hypothetical protein